MRDESSKAIVVTPTHRAVGDCIVLVDHWNHTEPQQPIDRPPRLQVRTAVEKVPWTEKNLSGDQSVPPECVLVGVHETGLSNGCCGLQRRGVTRSGVHEP